MVPMMVPRPPKIEVPPRTTAVMASSSMPVPMSERVVETRDTKITAASAAANPQGEVRVVTATLASHTRPPVLAWLAAHPRLQQVCSPVGACWRHLQAAWWRLFRRAARAGQSFATAGGQGSISISTASVCTWNTSDVPAWVTGMPPSGMGTQTIAFTVESNPGPARTALKLVDPERLPFDPDHVEPVDADQRAGLLRALSKAARELLSSARVPPRRNSV